MEEKVEKEINNNNEPVVQSNSEEKVVKAPEQSQETQKTFDQLVRENPFLNKFFDYPKGELELIKMYLLNDLVIIEQYNKERKPNDPIVTKTVKTCISRNYDFLSFVANCKYKVDTGDSTIRKNEIPYATKNKCVDCKCTDCLLFNVVNFKYSVDVINLHLKGNKITYIQVINYILGYTPKIYENKLDMSEFDKFSLFNLMYVQILLESNLVQIDHYENGKIKFKYLNVCNLENHTKFIDKLIEYFYNENCGYMEFDETYFTYDKMCKNCNYNQCLYKIAMYFRYLMDIKGYDVLGGLNEYLQTKDKGMCTNRSLYFRQRYINKVNDLPYNDKAKKKIIEIFNYIYNFRYNSAIPYIPINIVLYTKDKNIAFQIKELIGEFMWFYGYLSNDMKHYEVSMNKLIMDKFEVNRIYLEKNGENFITKKGIMLIHNFENVVFTDKLNSNLILNILSEQIELNNRNICNIIYGSKDELKNILMQYPVLNNSLFNIKLDIDELDTDGVYNVLVERFEEIEKLSDDVKEKLYSYIKSSYGNSEMKDLEYVNNLYNNIMLVKNQEPNIDNHMKIDVSHIPDPYNIRQLPEILKDLNELVGLDNIKNEINNLISLLKFNKRANLDMSKLNLHMVFTGNPGTGKTTVARLISDILYNLGYIKLNKLVEVSAKDLIGEYIGQTSGKTYNVMKSAFGGVLFIDEAYAISSNGGKTNFAEDCMSTIIKTMEDHKDNLVVIFAGYKNEMEKFIKFNSGLSSRIGYYVDFENYTIQELMTMFTNLLLKNNLTITDDAKEKVKEVIEISAKQENFGNARFVNNLFQNILLAHARNVENLEDISNNILEITQVDINKDSLIAKDENKNRIGF